jgi:opacity protein-like surface antigen
MNKSVSVAALAAALLFSAAPARAADDLTGGYAGLSVSRSEYSVDDESGSVDKTGAKAFGGYRFNRFFAAEMDYRRPGDVSNFAGSLELYGFTTSLVVLAPVSESVDLFARGGLLFWNLKAGVPGFGSVEDDGNDPLFGVGIQWRAWESGLVRFEYERADIENVNIEQVSLGVAYRFR